MACPRLVTHTESEWGSSQVSLVLLRGLAHLPHWENEEQGWEAFLGTAEKRGQRGRKRRRKGILVHRSPHAVRAGLVGPLHLSHHQQARPPL